MSKKRNKNRILPGDIIAIGFGTKQYVTSPNWILLYKEDPNNQHRSPIFSQKRLCSDAYIGPLARMYTGKSFTFATVISSYQGFRRWHQLLLPDGDTVFIDSYYDFDLEVLSRKTNI